MSLDNLGLIGLDVLFIDLSALARYVPALLDFV